MRKYYQAGLIFSILLLLVESVLLFAVHSIADRIYVNLGSFLVASVTGSLILGYTAWQTRRCQPRLFLSWLMLALGMLCNPLGAVLGAVLSVLPPIPSLPTSSIVSFALLVEYPLFLFMVALLPSRNTRRFELIQWLFDALVVVFSITLIFWVFVIQPELQASVKSLDVYLLAVANQAGDLLMLWALVMILFRRYINQRIEPLLWLFGSFSLLLIYDLITAAASPSAAVVPYSSFKEVLLTASVLYLNLAGLQQLLALEKPVVETKGAGLAGGWETARLMMPYLGLGASFSVLILSIAKPQALDTLTIAVWVALILVMVIVRQVLVIRENQRLSEQLFQLNAGLELHVTERTEALIAANQELLKRELTMTHTALHDALTDLPNRTLLIDRLGQAIRRMRREPNYAFGVLFMDLDGFKVINDSLGHVAGDKLLVKIAASLTSCVRAIDTVSRLGGDEFVILLDGCKQGDYVVETAQRVMKLFTTPLEVEGQFAYMAASMGIVPGSAEYDEPADILRDADLAMYEAKAMGKARYVVFTPELRTYALDRLVLEKDLHLALEKGQLTLNYQPILNLATGKIAGFEALLRWRHHALGMVSPGTFIPIAESNGTITPMTFWVLDEAIRQLSLWKREFPGTAMTMSVNLSARLFSQPDLLQIIEGMLANAELTPRDLILEITESAIIQDTSIAIKILRACQEIGIKVHMDDFGTGYSSLSHLHNFPLNALKVSQDFVVRILPGGENREIVRTIVTLAHDLGLEVIAEGIETPEQMDYIRQLGCQGGQGYFISRPLSPEDAAKFIARKTLPTAI